MSHNQSLRVGLALLALVAVSACSTKVERLGSSSFGELFRPPYLSRTAMMSTFNLLSVIGYYGFAAWVPTLLIDKGITVTTSLLYAFVIAIANPFGPLLGFFVADRMERKWQLVLSSIGIGGFMLAFALQTNSALIIVFGVLVTLCNNWLSFTFHNYQAELFPTRVRARAVGFVYAWGRVSAAFVGLLIGFFFRQGGTLAVALLMAAAMIGVILVIGIFGPKTLNQPLEEISN